MSEYVSHAVTGLVMTHSQLKNPDPPDDINVWKIVGQHSEPLPSGGSAGFSGTPGRILFIWTWERQESK